MDQKSPLTAGRLELGFSFAYGYRNEMQQGDQQVANMEGGRTQARVFTLEAALGLWRGLGIRLGLPILDVDYRNNTPGSEGDDTDVGDLWLRIGYTYALVKKPGWFRLSGSVGLSFPTGGQVAVDLPSNSGFASRTVNPLFQLDVSYDFRFGLGFYALGDVRWVPYARDGQQAGNSFLWGGGLRYRLLGRLIPSVGVYGLRRTADQMDGSPMMNSGLYTLYVSVGLAYAFQWKPLKGFGLHATVLIPAYHHVTGMQLVEGVNVAVGIRYSFAAWKPKGKSVPPPRPILPGLAWR
ncbi:MAG: hypothetical protein ABI333_20170 [bacterium]